MRHILTTLFSILLWGSMAYATSPSPKILADSAYLQQHYEQAIQQYEAILSQVPSATVYYNLGNAAYRSGQLGPAVLAYERALHLDPSHADAHHNLAIVRSQLPDHFSPSPSLTDTLLQHWARAATREFWVGISFIFWVVAFSLTALYRIGPTLLWKKIGFFGALMAFVIALIATLWALVQHHHFTHNHRAVIMSPTLSTYTSPTENSHPERTLHEGTTFEIVDTSGKDWVQIQLPDGNTVWVKNSGFQRVVTSS